MPVTEYLIRNAELYPDEVALVELNPDEKDTRRTTWKEFDLIQPSANMPYRREAVELRKGIRLLFLCITVLSGCQYILVY